MTCIAGFLRSDRVILAADSCVQSMREDGQHNVSAEDKIFHVDRWHFVIGGIHTYVAANGHNTYIDPVIQRAVARARPTSGRAVIETLVRELAPLLHDAFTDHQRRLPHLVARLSIYFGGVDAEGYLTLGRFEAETKHLHPLQIEARYQSFSANSPDVRVSFVAGCGPAIEANQQMPDWLKAGTPDAARRLIQLEIDACPTLVGPPIQIMEITKDGENWIEGEHTCRS